MKRWQMTDHKLRCLMFAMLAVLVLSVAGAVRGKAPVLRVLVGDVGDTYAKVQVIPEEDAALRVEYGVSGARQATTPTYRALRGEVIEIRLEALAPDEEYSYGVVLSGGDQTYAAMEGAFRTQRRKGSSFVFTVQSDSHRDALTDDALYANTLKNILGDGPDFHMDLGDTFMTEKFAKSEEAVRDRYLEERSFFEMIGGFVPVMLVNGNHEGENGFLLNKTGENLAVWASDARNKYFVTPSPGGIYSMSEDADKYAGLRGGHYAWEWGDAIFVVLDPFWYTIRKPGSLADNWQYTLGKEQYEWLVGTLVASDAVFKFVFCHNLVGGLDKDGRGGIEAAGYFEWGGYNPDGSYGFDSRRSGWEKPIHQVLAENGVDVFFHGHDHFFAKQELDGVIYQLVPQPGNPGSKDFRLPGEYGYKEGVFLPSPGHIRVSVSPDRAVIEYVASSTGQRAGKADNGTVAYSYSILP